MRLFDSELKVLDIIWAKEPVTAKEVSRIAAEEIGWSKNTTYTVIKKLVDKGYVRRDEPDFTCTALIKRGDVQRSETRGLVNRLFAGSRQALFSALLEDEELSENDIAELRRMIDRR